MIRQRERLGVSLPTFEGAKDHFFLLLSNFFPASSSRVTLSDLRLCFADFSDVSMVLTGVEIQC